MIGGAQLSNRALEMKFGGSLISSNKFWSAAGMLILRTVKM